MAALTNNGVQGISWKGPRTTAYRPDDEDSRTLS